MFLAYRLLLVVLLNFAIIGVNASNLWVDPQREDTNLQNEQTRDVQFEEDTDLQQEKSQTFKMDPQPQLSSRY